MAFTKPIFSLGLDVPNCAFQLPGDSSGLAAGWAVDAGAPAAMYGYFSGGIVGRPRLQRLVCSSSSSEIIRIVSAPASPYHLTVAEQTTLFGAMEVYASASGNAIALQVEWYDSAGVLTGAASNLISVATPLSGLVTGTATVTPPGDAVFAKAAVRITHDDGATMTVDLAFAGVGCWDGSSSGYFQPTRFPVMPGVTHRLNLPDPGRYRSDLGVVRVVDRSRHGRQNVCPLAFTLMPNSDKLLFEKLATLNGGRNWEGTWAAANPHGGSWPILLCPGMTGLPAAMLCDMTSGLAIEPDAEWGRTDPPFWNAAFEFTERG